MKQPSHPPRGRPPQTPSRRGFPAHSPCLWGKLHEMVSRCKAGLRSFGQIPPRGVGGLLLLFPALLHAQDVRLSYDKTAILIGEPIQMKIEASLGAGQSSDLFSLDTLPHFEVLDRSKIDTGRDGASLYLKQTVVLTSWDSGSWTLPSAIRNGVPLQPVAIEVGYTKPWDVRQPYHDIKGIVPVKNPGRSNWWWYLIGAAVLVALFLLFFPAGKKEKDESGRDSGAYKKALEQLEKLQKVNPSAKGEKQYYTDLINIFRTYLRGAKGIQSFSKTTDDLSVQLQSLKMPPTDYNKLVQSLRLSDLVKFAAYKPTAAATDDAFETVKKSITLIEQGNAV